MFIYSRTSGGEDEFDKSLSAITVLRKIAMHPLLQRHHYHDNLLREMAKEILQDPSHRDADFDLVCEDMTIMSDFELHCLCTETKVQW